MSAMLAAISFDPTIRGILVMVVATVVLPGSIYLIISTDTGPRLGFLIAGAGLFGWCFLMGVIWWVYGIGFVGRAPAWEGVEVNFDRTTSPMSLEEANKLPMAEDLPTPSELLDAYPADKEKALEDPAMSDIIKLNDEQGRLTLTKVVTLDGQIQSDLNEQLGGWRILPESDSRRGETVAASDAILISSVGSASTGFAASSDYYVEDVYYYGGKESTEPLPGGAKRSPLSAAWHRVESIFQLKNPTLYAAVTLKKAKSFPADPSTAPPPAQPRDDVSTVTVLLERNLGNKRAIPALFTVITGLMFAMFAWLLHLRDQRVMAMIGARK